MTNRTRNILRALGAAVWVLFVISGLLRTEIDTQTGSFLPRGDTGSRTLEAKERAFGGDPIVVILESSNARALVLDDAQRLELLRLEGTLAKLPDVAAVYGPATVLNQTAGAAQDMLAQISGRRDAIEALARQQALDKGLSKVKAAQTAAAAVAAFDRRYGALVVKALPAGLPTIRNSRFVQTVLFDENNKTRTKWKFIVPSATSVAILVRPRQALDQDAGARLVEAVSKTVSSSELQTVRTTVTGTPVIAAGLSSRAKTELPVLGAAAVVSVGAILLLTGWTTRRRSRLRPLVSALAGTATTIAGFGWFGAPLSLGIVAFLPIMLGIGSDFPLYLSRQGAIRPVIVAAGAATVGFGSLAFSPLPFVRQLGIALAIGVVATTAIATALRVSFGPLPVPPAEPSANPRTLGRRAGSILLGAAVLTGALGWVALPKLPIEAQPDKLAAGLPELKSAAYAEQILGSNGEVSVQLRGADVASPEVLAWADKAESAVVRDMGDTVHPILTLGDLFSFLGTNPTPDQVTAALQLVPRYLSSAVVTSDRKTALLVFGIEFDDIGGLGKTLDQLRSSLPPAPEGAQVDIVGLPVLAVRGLDLVSGGRVWMNLIGVLAAAVVVLLGTRSAKDTMRTVLTVLIATGWVAGIASATSASLNPLTVAVGSLVTATGCEFALMLGQPGSQRRIRHSGVATAAAAGVAGYLVLTFSDLAVLQNFGFLLALSVGASYLAALAVHQALPVAPTDSEPMSTSVLQTQETL